MKKIIPLTILGLSTLISCSEKNDLDLEGNNVGFADIDIAAVNMLEKLGIPPDSLKLYSEDLLDELDESNEYRERFIKVYKSGMTPNLVNKYEDQELSSLELYAKHNIGPNYDKNIPEDLENLRLKVYETNLSSEQLKSEFNAFRNYFAKTGESFIAQDAERFLEVYSKGFMMADFEKYLKLSDKYGEKMRFQHALWCEEHKVDFEYIENEAKKKMQEKIRGMLITH